MTPQQAIDDIVFCEILPRLPFKSLARFAAVCKAWGEVISGDPAFARAQAALPSPASVALIAMCNRRLKFLSPPAAVGVPDPSLSYLPLDTSSGLRLCACTNGLLALLYHCRSRGAGFVITNPATRQSELVKGMWSDEWLAQKGRLGLAFDPSASPAQYSLVVASVGTGADLSTEVSFAVFSSRTGGWVVLDAALLGLPAAARLAKKSAFAGGALHWVATSGHLIRYDVAKNRATALALPCRDGPGALPGNHDLAGCSGRLVLARAGPRGVGVWALHAAAARWELLHERRWDDVPGDPRGDIFCRVTMPAGFDAARRKMYLVLKTAARVGGGQQHWAETVCCYDMRTGEALEMRMTEGSSPPDEATALGVPFWYHNSMAALPGVV